MDCILDNSIAPMTRFHGDDQDVLVTVGASERHSVVFRVKWMQLTLNGAEEKNISIYIHTHTSMNTYMKGYNLYWFFNFSIS